MTAFPATSWSTILAARQAGEAEGDKALQALCEAYWYPLYAFLRRSGYSPEDAEDHTQGYFTILLEKQYLQDTDPSRGRFRSFLLKSMQHYLANERDKRQAIKRGGGRAVASLEVLMAESRYNIEPAGGLTPDQLFDRSWALALLDRALESLRKEYEQAGKAALFDSLKECLTGEDRVGSMEVAMRVAAHRLRKRFGRLLRREAAATVQNPSEIEEELRFLLASLSI